MVALAGHVYYLAKLGHLIDAIWLQLGNLFAFLAIKMAPEASRHGGAGAARASSMGVQASSMGVQAPSMGVQASSGGQWGALGFHYEAFQSLQRCFSVRLHFEFIFETHTWTQSHQMGGPRVDF